MKKTSIVAPRRGGRPSREQAGLIEDKILDAAAALFFTEGYGQTSIEKIAKFAQISKRTFYARFDDKAVLFRAVVHRVIEKLRPQGGTQATDQLFIGTKLEDILHKLAPIILRAALSAESLALYRIVLAEAVRFPEIALIMHQQGGRNEAITRITDLLEHDAKTNKRDITNAAFKAEQFLFMLTAAPQRRALGLGPALKEEELTAWAKNTVTLFLNGCL